MTHRIILFRGMNTGGVRAPVGEQRAMAEAMGLKNPRTLQASGNLVVESGKAAAALEADIEAAMEKTFGLKVAAMVRTPDQWAKLIAANPFPKQAAAHPAKVVAMVMKDGILDGALEAVRELAAGGEAVEAVGEVLYFWFPNGQGDSAIFKKATPRMLGMGTGRNWNTVLKLGEMVGLHRTDRIGMQTAHEETPMADTYDTLLIERHADGYAVATLNRPEALNALNSSLFRDLSDFLDAVEHDDGVRCLVLTGSGDKAFAAGADIKEMSDQSYADMYKANFFSLGHDRITRFRKPIIAAVNGFALGGGCELAMLCDFIVASEKAKFGQPEINLGVAPGIGGSQRLTRLVGKAKAMDMVLTARMMDAAEAERAGLASRVVPHEALMEEVRKIAARIAAQSPLAVMANKEMVNAALETTLTQGVQFERRLFHSLFAFEDQKEGMAAFVEKRKPVFTGR